jgi:hypothetical protein
VRPPRRAGEKEAAATLSRVGLLGSATVVDARTGRKLNNALTLTFKTGADQTIAVGAQVGSPWVLLGFKNTGDAGRCTLKGAGGDLELDCRTAVTTVTAAVTGSAVGTITREGDDGLLREGAGGLLARLVGLPKSERRDPVCAYPLFDPAGGALGTLSLLTTAATFDLLADLVDTTVYWETAAPLKVPTLGARLDLVRPVEAVLGDLLLSTCMTIAIGPQAFIQH